MTQNECPDPTVTVRAMHGAWLVSLSVLFAVFLEVTPVERNVVGILLSLHSVPLTLILVVRAACLTLILLPLAIYTAINGFRALKHVWGRVTLVGVIVAVNLAIDLFVIWQNCRGC